MEFWNCVVYFAVIGVLSFIIGRCLPEQILRWDKFPFAAFPFEEDGKIYNRLKIRKWQDKIPDMSKILPWFIPRKKMPETPNAENIRIMLRETCNAELVHAALCVAGLYCIKLWPGCGGWILAVVYGLGNVPFMLVQRFNRPRLLKLLSRYERTTVCPNHTPCARPTGEAM